MMNHERCGSPIVVGADPSQTADVYRTPSSPRCYGDNVAGAPPRSRRFELRTFRNTHQIGTEEEAGSASITPASSYGFRMNVPGLFRLTRMFPTVKVSISNIDTDGLYYVFLDVIPVDNKRYRYIYNKSAWLTAGKAEPAPKNRLYLHPDSPYTGEQLLKQVVSFEKAKLTNNEIDKAGHLILNSMHKYQPRIHVVRRSKGQHLDQNKMNLADEVHRTFVFTETQFMAVTAYQNQLITKLKIEKNPFAKGFRDPSGRSPEYEPDSRSDIPLIMPMYNPMIFQHALLSQYYLKAAAARVMPSLNPSMLSHVLLSQMPSMPNSGTDLQLNTMTATPASKSEGLPI
ncbi:unnamed protein product [Nippostrongylus brasiliensis]|uniref:T-box protein 12 (inferred by orthology to a C. elegans protein) n=1 Tax=Nippostrongylus brasiliensis TaxID=27835 RepID=A0A0N4Y0H3_NIPBR|nr:unnamed protein product [Nippostrongylus brasiliensis]